MRFEFAIGLTGIAFTEHCTLSSSQIPVVGDDRGRQVYLAHCLDRDAASSSAHISQSELMDVALRDKDVLRIID